jgi:transketolase
MGKGVPFLEQREKNHFIRVDPPEWQLALQLLDASQGEGARHEQAHPRPPARSRA